MSQAVYPRLVVLTLLVIVSVAPRVTSQTVCDRACLTRVADLLFSGPAPASQVAARRALADESPRSSS